MFELAVQRPNPGSISAVMDVLLIDDHQPFDFLQTAGYLAAYRLHLRFQPIVIVGRFAALTYFVAIAITKRFLLW